MPEEGIVRTPNTSVRSYEVWLDGELRRTYSTLAGARRAYARYYSDAAERGHAAEMARALQRGTVAACEECGQLGYDAKVYGVCSPCKRLRADRERAEASGEQLSLGALAPLAPDVPGQLGL